MLTFGRPPRSLWIFLICVIAIGATFGHLIDAAGFAAFFLFISSITGKPAWRFWFDPPGDVDSGRACGRFNTWQRVGATSPKQIRRLPRDGGVFLPRRVGARGKSRAA
jgi:hypothetical protein